MRSASRLIDSWKAKFLFPATGMIPIDRAGGSASQHRASTPLHRWNVATVPHLPRRWHPHERHRTCRGAPAADTSALTGAPIIPVGIRGTDRIQPVDTVKPSPVCPARSTSVGRSMPRPRDGRNRQDDRRVLRQITDEVEFEVAELSGQTYVDSGRRLRSARPIGCTAGSAARGAHRVVGPDHRSSRPAASA
ncbi:MAG: hypothetical protein R2710_05540 [Acidimicrobiales bacterium]